MDLVLPLILTTGTRLFCGLTWLTDQSTGLRKEGSDKHLTRGSREDGREGVGGKMKGGKGKQIA